MATASGFPSEDQFMCSICLDIFTEPVSIPCGHNFCKACLTRHWSVKEQHQCPLCNEKHDKGLKLRVNTGFRELVESYKKHNEITVNNSPVKPGQVPCDCCLGNKLRAYKTCLVCLASFCETHLESHQTAPALKRHKLTNPVHNLKDKICMEHNRIFELFCRNDNIRVCAFCTDHRDHDTVPLEEDYVNKQVQMRTQKPEVQVIKQRRGKKGQKVKVAVQNKTKSRHEARGNGLVCNQMLNPQILWCPSMLPHHFIEYCYIPADRGFSQGRFYYEVQFRGRTGWDFGVIRESMCGIFTPNTRNKNWIIRLKDYTCNALQNISVLVCVDYVNGLVSFYNAHNGILIYSFTNCRFNKRVFLFLRPAQEDGWEWRICALVCFVVLIVIILIFLSG